MKCVRVYCRSPGYGCRLWVLHAGLRHAHRPRRQLVRHPHRPRANQLKCVDCVCINCVCQHKCANCVCVSTVLCQLCVHCVCQLYVSTACGNCVLNGCIKCVCLLCVCQLYVNRVHRPCASIVCGNCVCQLCLSCVEPVCQLCGHTCTRSIAQSAHILRMWSLSHTFRNNCMFRANYSSIFGVLSLS
jgi:hypothetical protein